MKRSVLSSGEKHLCASRENGTSVEGLTDVRETSLRKQRKLVHLAMCPILDRNISAQAEKTTLAAGSAAGAGKHLCASRENHMLKTASGTF